MEELCHVIVKGIPKRLLFSMFIRETYNCYYCTSSYHQHRQAYQTERISLTCLIIFRYVFLSFLFFFLISGPVATKHQPEVLQYFNGNDRTERKPYPNKDHPGIWYIICLSYMKHSKLSLCKRLFFSPFLFL